MKFTPLYDDGPILIDMDKHEDERGFFARSFCEKEFEQAGLPVFWPQSNVSFNNTKGTVRGMHYQIPPHIEPKIVRCTKGAILDAVIDLRKNSSEYCKTHQVELTDENHKALYIPAGFAHGFQTLEDNTEVLYNMGAVYEPSAQRGAKWNDPAFTLNWPLEISTISERDADYPDFDTNETVF